MSISMSPSQEKYDDGFDAFAVTAAHFTSGLRFEPRRQWLAEDVANKVENGLWDSYGKMCV